MRKLLKLVAAGIVGAFVFAPLPTLADDETLNAGQKDAVKALIKETLINNPEIVMEAIRKFQQEQAEAEEKAKKHALIQSKDLILNDPTSPVLGNPEGDITLVEFFDYRCGYCKRVFPSVMKLLKDDGNIKYVVKEFPILGSDSMFASRAALAAHEQGKYLEMHMALMKLPGSLSKDKVLGIAKSVGLDIDKLKKDITGPNVNKAIDSNYMLAQSLGISGTPAFIIGDELVPGAIGIERMAALVKEAREKKKSS